MSFMRNKLATETAIEAKHVAKPAKRRGLHLVTVVLLLVLLAIFIWYNVARPHRFFGGSSGGRSSRGTMHGWPCQRSFSITTTSPDNVITYKFEPAFLYNALFVIGALFNTGVLCECIVRRKQRDRSLLRFHLQTLLAFICAVAVLLWLNVKPQETSVYQYSDGKISWTIVGPGWPETLNSYTYDGCTQTDSLRRYYTTFFRNDLWSYRGRQWSGNLAVALVLIGTVVIGCEWYLRRRDYSRA
jgi:hypothetical protein